MKVLVVVNYVANGYLQYIVDQILSCNNDCEIHLLYMSSQEIEEIPGIEEKGNEVTICNGVGRKYRIHAAGILLQLKVVISFLHQNGYQRIVVQDKRSLIFLYPILRLWSKRLDILLEGRLKKVTLPVFVKILYRLRYKIQNNILRYLCRRFKITLGWGYPRSLVVESSNLCNVRCITCYSSNNAIDRPRGNLAVKPFAKLMQEGGRYLDYLCLHLMGDPLMNKNIGELVRVAKQNGVEYVELGTNGSFSYSKEWIKNLIQSGLNTLIVCVDGYDQETQEKFRRGTKIGLILNFIREVNQAKKELGSFLPIIQVQTIIMKHNYKHLDRIWALSKEYGANTFRTVIFYFSDNLLPGKDDSHIRSVLKVLDQYIADDEKYQLIYMDNGKLRERRKNPRKLSGICIPIWDSMVISWDGDALPCCTFAASKRHAVGDVFERGLKVVWSGPEMVRLRHRVLTDRRGLPQCQRCGN